MRFRRFFASLVGVIACLLALHANATTIYVPSVAPQTIPWTGNTGPDGPTHLANTSAMLGGALYTNWQNYDTRGPGSVTPGAGPAVNGTPQMLQSNAFLVSTPLGTPAEQSTKAAFGTPILKNPNAVQVSPTGGANGVTYYNPSDYFTYEDLVTGRLSLSYSFHNPLDTTLPESISIGFLTSNYPPASGDAELKFEPAYNSTMTDQSSGVNGPLYNNPDRWITTPNIINNTAVWNRGGLNEGPIGVDPELNSVFGGNRLLGLIIGMGSGVPGRQSWIDNVTLSYDGTNGGTAFSYSFDFADVAPAAVVPPAPEPGSLVLLGLGSLLLMARRRR